MIIKQTESTAQIFQNIKQQQNQNIFRRNNSFVQNLFENVSRLAIIKSVIPEENPSSKLQKDIQLQETNYNQKQIENYESSQQDYNPKLTTSILNALTYLGDNQQKSKVLKAFISVHINFQSYEKMKYIIQYLSKELASYIEHNYNVNILKQLNDAYRMQIDQQISNVLFFEAPLLENKIQYNSAFLATYLMHIWSQKNLNMNSKNKIIFINLTGIQNNDADIYKLFPNGDCLYISLQRNQNALPQQENKFQSQHQSNFKTILIQNCQEELTWQKFKIIYKFILKNHIKSFKSTLFILSVAKQFENENCLQFSEDCLKNIVKKFSYLAKDRLIIHSYISQSEKAEPNQNLSDEKAKNKNLQDEKIQQLQLITFINSLQQGILSQDLLLFDKNKQQTDQIEYIKWIQNLVDLNYKTINFDTLDKIKRELRNLMMNSQMQLIQNQNFKLGVCILKDDIQNQVKNDLVDYQIIYLFYEGKNIQFLQNTILYVDYTSKQIVLLQYENEKYFVYFEYFNKLDSNKQDLNCQRFELSNELEKQNKFLDDSILKNSSLIVSDQNIYIVYYQCGQEIIIINTQNLSVVVLKRNKLIYQKDKANDKLKIIYNQDQKNVEMQIQDRRKPAIVKNQLCSGFNFAIFGGEFLNSNKVCNLIELLQLNSNSFASIIIPKQNIFEKCSFYIPWPNMIVLVTNQQPSTYVLLPGDYNNKNVCYNQVINKEHQENAIMITSHKDSLKFQIEKLKIVYDISNLQQKEIPIPIQYFSGNQINIKHPEKIENQQKWHLAITLLEQFNQNQDAGFSKLVQLYILAEIQIKPIQKELRIKQSFKRLQCSEVLQKKIVNYHEEKQTKYNYIICQRQQ
ncbi:unnamed protein product [Paramecium sonneborni]|uniref:Uncharacterized protein n=1 Tax=Paramecium sonneborni TaxID=65129 RepID=A0A8S1K3V7_9CILI|nr:unnamed protein product [Paramecium sonneborni]